MLNNLKIEHFRGINACELTNLSHINLLIGPNNSGKSSVLEALYLASLSVNLNNYGSINPLEYLLNRRVRRSDQDLSRLWHNYDQSKDIVLQMQFNDKQNQKVKIIVNKELKMKIEFSNRFIINS